MKPALIAVMIFVAGLTPGLLKHGQPLPDSGRNVSRPVAAFSGATNTVKPAAGGEKPTLLARLSRWTGV